MRQLHILSILLLSKSFNCETIDSGKCFDYKTDFEVSRIVGFWRVVAIIPDVIFPKEQSISCYKVEFSETEADGLRWLIKKTLGISSPELTNKIQGTIIRQRYFARKPFDVWSMNCEVPGCFEQILTLDGSDKRILKEAITSGDKMQLHIVDAHDGTKPVLLQILWGKLISVVIYSRNQDITSEQIKIIKDMMTKLRGPQMELKFCDQLLLNQRVLEHI